MPNIYDLVILAILIFAAVRGAIKGFVWQLAVIASLLLCFAFSESGSLLIAPHLPLESPLNRWVAMLILYIVLSLAAFGTARLLHSWIEKARFKEYDRHLGFLFGAVKGVLIGLVLTFFVVTISEKYRENVMHSHSGYAAAIIMDRMHPVMPHELHDVLEPYIHQLDQPGMDLRHSHQEDDHRHDDERALHASDAETDEHENASLIERLLEQIPRAETLEDGHGHAELRTLIETALENTSAANRPELIEELTSAGPAMLRAIAEAWENGKPDIVVETPPFDEDLSATGHDALLEQIATVFSDEAATRADIIAAIEGALVGVPDQVATAALRDWHADLKGLTPDPDPQTDATMSLDARIVRQLELAGVPISALSSSLQDRLRESLR